MDTSVVNMDQSQGQIKRKRDDNNNDPKVLLKQCKTPVSYKDILGLIDKYMHKQEAGDASSDLLSLAVLALDQHENGKTDLRK
jgi:hypothetical protein